MCVPQALQVTHGGKSTLNIMKIRGNSVQMKAES